MQSKLLLPTIVRIERSFACILLPRYHQALHHVWHNLGYISHVISHQDNLRQGEESEDGGDRINKHFFPRALRSCPTYENNLYHFTVIVHVFAFPSLPFSLPQ